MIAPLLQRLGIQKTNSGVFAGEWSERPGGDELVSINPATEQPIAAVRTASAGWETNSAGTSGTSGCSSRSKWERSAPKEKAKSRR